MAKLEVLRFPDERLRTVARPVDNIDDNIRQLVEDMLETMYAEKGVGLAATQVNVHRRVVVIDVSEDGNEPLVLINPQITARSEETVMNEEGCLSVPGCYASVERHARVTVKAQDQHAQEFSLDADGLLAICIQHELDHLQGKLFVDYLSPLKRQRIRKKLEKEQRLAAKNAPL